MTTPQERVDGYSHAAHCEMSIPSEVQDLIDGSGNTFHAKVARWLTSNGWSIAISPYYMDQSQQKARELDLIAEKVSTIRGSFGDFRGEVAVRLFVECKFLPGYAVFWFNNKDRVAIEQVVCRSGPFRPSNTYTADHHYLSSGDRAAKLFASLSTRGQESEQFYKALNQSLNGLISLRGRVPRSFSAASVSGFRLVLDFPVIVCNSFERVYAADFGGADATTVVSENFQLEVEYAYIDAAGGSRDELFVVDVVEYEKLSSFVSLIDNDALLAGEFFD